VVADLVEIKDLLHRTEKTPSVETQERCADASDRFSLESKVESKVTQGIAASLTENLRSIADAVANAIPAVDTVAPSSPVEVQRNFDFACSTPSGSITPGAAQSGKQQVRNESPLEAAEELVELLKYAYEGTQPLNIQYLRGLEWHYADLCQRVEVQLGRLMGIVQDSESRARMELFCCSARLISSLGAAMPRILLDPSAAFGQAPDMPEIQRVNVHVLPQRVINVRATNDFEV